MVWEKITINQIPKKKSGAERKSWKPNVEDVTAVFEMLLSGGEAIQLKMKDGLEARSKAEAMLKWIKTSTCFPVTLTSFARDNVVVVANINMLNGADCE